MKSWRCPRCDRALQHPRVVPWGCCGTPRPVGECPMHQSMTPAVPWQQLYDELNAAQEVVSRG